MHMDVPGEKSGTRNYSVLFALEMRVQTLAEVRAVLWQPSQPHRIILLVIHS